MANTPGKNRNTETDQNRKLDQSGVARGLKIDNLQKFFKALASGDEKQIEKISDQMAEMGMRPPPPELIEALLMEMEAQVQQGQGADPQQQVAASQTNVPPAQGLGQLLAGGGQPGAEGGSPEEMALLQQMLSGASI